MLWYKSWLDTRWRFLLGLALLLVFACGTVVSFSTVQELFASVSPSAISGSEDLRQEFEESLEIMRTFRGYVWLQWFQQNFSGLLTIFAALLGSGSPLVQSGSGALFSLALPVSRGRWIAARAGAGLAELLVLALAPSVAFAALAPFVGEQLSVGEALVYGAVRVRRGQRFFQRRGVHIVARQRRLAAAAAHVPCRSGHRRAWVWRCLKVTGCSRRWRAAATSRMARCPGSSCSSVPQSPRDFCTPPPPTSRGGTFDHPPITKGARYVLFDSCSRPRHCIATRRLGRCRPGHECRRSLGRSDSCARRGHRGLGRSRGRRVGQARRHVQQSRAKTHTVFRCGARPSTAKP